MRVPRLIVAAVGACGLTAAAVAAAGPGSGVYSFGRRAPRGYGFGFGYPGLFGLGPGRRERLSRA